MENKIYISGMHSGQNPCPGTGIARCLKKAFPALTLVGVDHWQGSSGFHDASVDEVLLLPQWKQIHNERHATQIRTWLDAGSLWFSSLDVEVHWLSKNMKPHPGLLAPGKDALKLTAKPAVRAFENLGFRVPEYLSVTDSDSEIHHFLRHSSWQCWLKSPYHDAVRISSWGAFERARRSMSKAWKTSKLFLQRHVLGNEESLVFAAYRGELISAIHLQKRLMTSQGKTWAGRVTPVLPETFERLQSSIRKMEWSGGGEIEFVRDPDDQTWVIECNPRFPAWIYGAALCGLNLPAQIISRVWDLPHLESVSQFPFFTRVVQEIPAKEWVGLPLPPEPTSMVWVADSKKTKGSAVESLTPDLNTDDPGVETGVETEPENETNASAKTAPPEMISEIDALLRHYQGESPARMVLKTWTETKFRTLAEKIRRSDSLAPQIKVGFSVKTSPTQAHLDLARKYGFLAECISQMEVQRALASGFQSSEIILNGPGKFWPTTEAPVTDLRMLFCDSIEEFDRVIEIPKIARCIGFRMKVPKLHSRFGNALDDFENFQRITARVKKIRGKAELGFHFHMPSWAIGVERWTEGLESLLIWCEAIERLTRVPIARLDFGGGFFPSDLESLDLTTIQETVASKLPKVRELYFEPGRALTQESEVLLCRTLDVRRSVDGSKIDKLVVDGCIAELPLAQAYSHRIFYRPSKGSCIPLSKGPTRILGRICMEDDILHSGVRVPDSVELGDWIVVADAGAYERSMSYVFGRG